jgi:superfamily II DNA helicase RecQ
MAFRFFVIPINQDSEAEAQLNAFLGSHKILNVDRRWVDQGTHSFWSFCIDYLPSGGKSRTGDAARADQRQRIDYREKLPPEQFRVFAALRELRKQIAQAEAVPVYTIFTNEQLAQMVTTGATSKAALEKIVGVGEARVAKYGERFVELLTRLLGTTNAANGLPV